MTTISKSPVISEKSPVKYELKRPIVISELPHIEGYEFTKLLKKGGAAEVFLGKDLSTDEEIVLKIAVGYDSSATVPYLMNMMQNEVNILQQLDHERIIKEKEHFIYKSHPCCVMKYLDGDNLFKLTHLQNKINIDTHFIAFFLGEMLELLIHIHEKGVLHKDISLSNIILTRDGHYHLIDFGHAEFMNSISFNSIKFIDSIYPAPDKENNYFNPCVLIDIFLLADVCKTLIKNFIFNGKKYFSSNNSLSKNEEILSVIDKHLLESIDKALYPTPYNKWTSAKEWYEDIKDLVLAAKRSDSLDMKVIARTLLESDLKINIEDVSTVPDKLFLRRTNYCSIEEPPTGLNYSVNLPPTFIPSCSSKYTVIYVTNPLLIKIINTWRRFKLWCKYIFH